MKNSLLVLAFLAISSIVTAQTSDAIKQKEKISFPELLGFIVEFENYSSCKNKIERIVSDKYWLKGPV